MATSLYDLAIAAAKEKTVWYKSERREVWGGESGGKPVQVYLKRDGGYVGLCLSVGSVEFNELFSVLILTPDKGWELLLLSDRGRYDTWAKRAERWVAEQKRARRVQPPTAPAMWVSEVAR